MPGKTTAGFTKSAQKQKFIRNRDIQLKSVEIKKEQRIQQGMVEGKDAALSKSKCRQFTLIVITYLLGVCTKCRLKAQWRFRYDKYKPLKAPANCGNCRKKVVLKAYRAFCDPCAQQKHVCPGCGGKLDDPSAASEDVVLDENEMMLEDELDRDQSKSTKLPRTEATSSASSTAVSSMETDAGDALPVDTAEGGTATAAESTGIRGGDWDARKYHGIAASKYSKNRVVGASNDTVFGWGETKEASDDSHFVADAPGGAEEGDVA